MVKWKNTTSKEVFGGVCHLFNGDMFGGVYKDCLIVRIGEQKSIEALKQPKVKPLDITGRPMKGWVMVEKDEFQSDRELSDRLEMARQFVLNLPPK